MLDAFTLDQMRAFAAEGGSFRAGAPQPVADSVDSENSAERYLRST